MVRTDPLMEAVVGAAWAPPVVPLAAWGAATVAAAVSAEAVGAEAALLPECGADPLTKGSGDESRS